MDHVVFHIQTVLFQALIMIQSFALGPNGYRRREEHMSFAPWKWTARNIRFPPQNTPEVIFNSFENMDFEVFPSQNPTNCEEKRGLNKKSVETHSHVKYEQLSDIWSLIKNPAGPTYHMQSEVFFL